MPENEPSKAIVVSFWGAMLAMVCAYFVLAWNPWLIQMIGEKYPQNVPANKLHLFVVLVLVFRHQCRVAFFDSSHSIIVDRGFEKVMMILLLPAATLGGIMLLFFKLGVQVGAAAMAVYSILFIVIGYCSAVGQKGGEGSDKKKKMTISWIIDFCNFVLWGIVCLSGTPPEGRVWFFVVIILFAMLVELSKVFFEGLMEKFHQTKSIMFGH